MPISPSERQELEKKIEENNAQIARKQARLDEGVGPIERKEIEEDIAEKEGAVRNWMNEIRVREREPGE